MRRTLALVVAVAAAGAGCSYDEWKYQQAIVEAECEYAIACYDDAVLTFYGWNNVEDCTAERGSEYATAVLTCTYDADAAKQCVKELGELACNDGSDPSYPAVCDSVYTGCDSGDTALPADTGS